MIDYNKLKIAHELANKVRPSDGCITIYFAYQIGSDGELKPLYSVFTEDRDGMTDDLDFYNIDDVIAKLRKLTQPESKYKVGERVWYSNFGVPIHAEIEAIELDEGGNWIMLKNVTGKSREEFFYPTKSTLIEAQIDYWRDQLSEELEQHVSDYCKPKPAVLSVTPDKLKSLLGDKCRQHESDGKSYLSTPPQYKCIKCGEFYR